MYRHVHGASLEETHQQFACVDAPRVFKKYSHRGFKVIPPFLCPEKLWTQQAAGLMQKMQALNL